MEDQTNLQEAYKTALREAGCPHLAKGTINNEVMPFLQKVNVQPESIEEVVDTVFFFYFDDKEGMCKITLKEFDDTYPIGYYLGRDKFPYLAAVGEIKKKGEELGYLCLYRMILIKVKGKSDFLECYYMYASARRREIYNERKPG